MSHYNILSIHPFYSIESQREPGAYSSGLGAQGGARDASPLSDTISLTHTTDNIGMSISLFGLGEETGEPGGNPELQGEHANSEGRNRTPLFVSLQAHIIAAINNPPLSLFNLLLSFQYQTLLP